VPPHGDRKERWSLRDMFWTLLGRPPAVIVPPPQMPEWRRYELGGQKAVQAVFDELRALSQAK